MVMAALSPSSVLATPIQVSPQVRNDLRVSVPQVAQDAQKTVKAAQTDTIAISAQALKMADDKNVAAKEADNKAKADEQESAQSARDKAADAKNMTQRNAEKTYAAVSANQ